MARHTEKAIFIDYISELHRAVHALGLFIDERFGPDISQPEALVLVQLRHAGPSTINDVHRRFLHRRSTLTSVLDRLESKGYIARETAPGDRRSTRISLTREGRKHANAIAAALERLGAEVAVNEQTVRLLSATAAATSQASS